MCVSSNQNFVTLYVNLFKACEKWDKNAGLAITRRKFNNDYALHALSKQVRLYNYGFVCVRVRVYVPII